MQQATFTIGTAAKETGKSKATISREIKKGKLSAKKKEDGSYEIQAVELFRVYPRKETPETGASEQSATPEKHSELIELQVKVKVLEEQLTREREQCDHWRGQAERISLMLTDQRERPSQKPVEGPLTFWQWIGLAKR